MMWIFRMFGSKIQYKIAIKTTKMIRSLKAISKAICMQSCSDILKKVVSNLRQAKVICEFTKFGIKAK